MSAIRLEYWKGRYGSALNKIDTYNMASGEIVKLASPVYYAVRGSRTTVLGTEAKPISRSAAGISFQSQEFEQILLNEGFLTGAIGIGECKKRKASPTRSVHAEYLHIPDSRIATKAAAVKATPEALSKKKK